MWMCTQYGFFSIVQNGNDPATHMVRARDKGDLDNLIKAVWDKGNRKKVISTPNADYAYRIIVSHDDMRNIALVLFFTVNYPNFKDRIAQLPSQAKKLHAYHEIWAIMKNTLQPFRKRGTVTRRVKVPDYVSADPVAGWDDIPNDNPSNAYSDIWR